MFRETDPGVSPLLSLGVRESPDYRSRRENGGYGVRFAKNGCMQYMRGLLKSRPLRGEG